VGVDAEYGALVMSVNWLANNLPSFFEPIATLAATFIGAWLAFKYQSGLEKKKETDGRVDAGNRVLFQLAGNISWLTNTKRQLIDPYRENPGRMFEMLPDLSPVPVGTLDFQSISFLLGGPDADVLGNLLLESRKFEMAVSLQARRSRFYLDDIYPKIEAARIRHGQYVHEPQMRAAVGDVGWFMLESITNHYVDQVDSALISHLELVPILRSALIRAVPQGKFIDVKLDAAGQSAA
jgi:hypothetical protein